MMFGMFGLGWLMMILVIGLPILLVVLVLGGTVGFLQIRDHSSITAQNQSPGYHSAVNSAPLASPAARYCSHCGAGLQSDWTHCPQCGAPIQ
jgi:hypothetical protein